MSDSNHSWLTPSAAADIFLKTTVSKNNQIFSSLATAVNLDEDANFNFWSTDTLIRSIKWYYEKFSGAKTPIVENSRDLSIASIKKIFEEEVITAEADAQTPIHLLFRGVLAFGNHEIPTDEDITKLATTHGILNTLPRSVKIYRILCIQRDIIDEFAISTDPVRGVNIPVFVQKSINDDISKIMSLAVKENTKRRIDIATKAMNKRSEVYERTELYVGEYQNGYNLLLLESYDMKDYIPLSEDCEVEPLLSRSFLLSPTKRTVNKNSRDIKDEIRSAASFVSDVKNIPYADAVAYVTKLVEFYNEHPYKYISPEKKRDVKKESRFKLSQFRELFKKHSTKNENFEESFTKLIQDGALRVDGDNIWWFENTDYLKNIFDNFLEYFEEGIDVDSNGYVKQLVNENINIDSLYPFSSRYRMDEDENDDPMLEAFDDLLEYETEYMGGIIGMKFTDIQTLYDENPSHSVKFMEAFKNLLPKEKKDNILFTLTRKHVEQPEHKSVLFESKVSNTPSKMTYRVLRELYLQENSSSEDFDIAFNALLNIGLVERKDNNLYFHLDVADLFEILMDDGFANGIALAMESNSPLLSIRKLGFDKDYNFMLTDILENVDEDVSSPMVNAFRKFFKYTDDSGDDHFVITLKFADIEALFNENPQNCDPDVENKSFKHAFILYIGDNYGEAAATTLYEALSS